MASKFCFLLILFLSNLAVANECLLNEALKDPALSGNPRFWQEYGELTQKKGHPSDIELQALIRKFGGKDVSDSTSPSSPVAASLVATNFVKGFDLKIQHKAEKEISKLPPKLKGKVDEFLSSALKPGGIKDLHDNPGKWHFEKLNHGHNQYTVRLNEGYRVLFELQDGDLKVLRVNKGQIHGI